MMPRILSAGSENKISSSHRLVFLFDLLFFLVALWLCILVFVPFEPTLPSQGLDPSWMYGTDYASTKHLPFGSALVFTAGPFVSLYTRFYVPDHRAICCIVDFLLISAFSIGVFWSTGRPNRYALMFIPVVIASGVLVDALFFVFPVAIVAIAGIENMNRRLHFVLLTHIVVIFSVLPLIKGTMTLPLGGAVVVASVISLNRRRLEGLALPIIAGVSLSLWWLLIGQNIGDLPYYFLRQIYIMSGYTDAMSLWGPAVEIYVYLGCAFLILLGKIFPNRASRLLDIGLYALILFIAFKAGFVRHDGHALIAASALILTSILSIMRRATTLSSLAFAFSMTGWIWIDNGYISMTLPTAWQRFADTVTRQQQAFFTTVTAPQQFAKDFENAKRTIASQIQLPRMEGVVDDYPDDQVLLLALDRDYYPRPVLQSYSAYTPELARLNREALYGKHAADTIVFRLAPIDDRFPALDDGLSWPDLLTLYKFRTFSHGFAVFDRTKSSRPYVISAPIVQGVSAFDHSIALPGKPKTIWAKLKFHPTFWGRLVSIFWKSPELTIDVKYSSGQGDSFRMIAGMASEGFLLSPAVASTEDVVGLLARDSGLQNNRKIKSIQIHQNTIWALWGSTFDVTFSELRLPSDANVDKFIAGALVKGPAVADFPATGKCAVDMVGLKLVAGAPVSINAESVTVTGWSLVDPHDDANPNKVRLAMTPVQGGPSLFAAAERQPRPDVDAYFHIAHASNAGFSARLDLRALKGHYTLNVVEDTSKGPMTCASQKVDITLRQ